MSKCMDDWFAPDSLLVTGDVTGITNFVHSAEVRSSLIDYLVLDGNAGQEGPIIVGGYSDCIANPGFH